MEWTTVSGSPTIDATTFRSGSYAGNITSLASGTAKGFLYQFASTGGNGPYYIRFYIYITTLPSSGNSNMVFTFNNGTTLNSAVDAGIKLRSSGVLALFNASGSQVGSDSSALNLSQWYRVEIKLDYTGGAGAQKLDCQLEGTSFASTTTGSGGGVVVSAAIGGNLSGDTQTVGTWYFDDIAINDSTGSNQTSFPGSGKIVHLRPNAAGDNNGFATQTGGTAGSANNYTRVNEVTPDDATSFNASSTVNTIDDFNIDNTPSTISSSDTINVVQVGFRHESSSSTIASDKIKARIKSQASGTVVSGTEVQPQGATNGFQTNTTAAPRNHTLTSYTDPQAGGVWTKTLLDSTQIGYTISTEVNTNSVRITAIWLLVDWTPSLYNKVIKINQAINRSNTY